MSVDTGYQFTNESSTNYASLCSNAKTSRPQHTCRHSATLSCHNPSSAAGSIQRRPRFPVNTNCHIRLTGIYSFWTYMLELTNAITKVTVAETRSFLQRVGIACYADGCISTGESVCPSVCPPSHAGIVSRRMKLRSCGFHRQVGQSSSFWRGKDRLKIRRGSPLASELKCGGRLSQSKIHQ